MESLSLMKKINLIEIFHYSYNIYKKNLLHYIILSFTFITPAFFISLLSFNSIKKINEINSMIKSNPHIFPKYIGEILKISSLSLLLVLIIFIFFFLMKISIIKATEEIINNKKKSIKFIFLKILKLFLPSVLTFLLSVLLIFFGFLFFLIPGIIFLSFLMFIPQIASIENIYFSESIKRSFTLLKKSFWPVAAIPLLFYFIYLTVFYSIFFLMNIDMIKNFKSGMSFLYFQEGITFKFIFLQIFGIFSYIISQPFLHIAMTIKFINIKNLIKLDRL